MTKYKNIIQNQKGAVAVEFAIIATPLILLVVFFIEFTAHLFINSLMDHAVEDIARLMKTNQVTQPNFSREMFLDRLFDPQHMAVFNRNNMYVDVRTVQLFTDLGIPLTATGSIDVSQLQFRPGGPGSINVIRTFYEFPTFLAYQDFGINDLWPNGNRLMTSSAAFQIEQQ